MSKKHSVRHTGMCFMIAITMLSVEGMRAQHLDTDSITGRVHGIPNVMVNARQLPNKVTSTILAIK